jgi:hypothetical protein
MGTELVQRYFDLAPQSDVEAYFDQFTPDAVVQDDGHTYRGVEEIRAWRTEVPRVSYRVHGIGTGEDGSDAQVDIAGDFPGSPVRLGFHFEFTPDGRITALHINP